MVFSLKSTAFDAILKGVSGMYDISGGISHDAASEKDRKEGKSQGRV